MDMRSWSSRWATNHTIYIDLVFLHKYSQFSQPLRCIDGLHVYDPKDTGSRKALSGIRSSAAQRETRYALIG